MSNQLTFFHTADWHLGKKLFKESRYAEHSHFLQWLLEQGKQQRPDLLIIAGDIFDSPIPPTESLKQYFEFLKDWHQQLPDSHIIIVAGNHDSGRFLEAPNSWLAEKNISIYGSVVDTQPLTIYKNNTPVTFYPLAYFRTNEVYKKLKEQNPEFDSEAWEQDDNYVLEQLHNFFKPTTPGRNILIAHHVFGQFSSGNSEQAISFAGKNTLPLSLFKEHFDYVALGHIHKFQKISSTPPAYYVGSPIPFRFSESNQKYIVNASIALDSGAVELTPIKIPLLKKLFTLKVNQDNYGQMLKQFITKHQHDVEIYLLIKLTTNTPLPAFHSEIIEQLSSTNIQLLNIQTSFTHHDSSHDQQELKRRTQVIYRGDIHQAFKLFYQEKTGQSEVPPELTKEFSQLLESASLHGRKR